MTNRLKRVRRQTRALAERVAGTLRHNRAAQLAVAGVAAAVTTRLLRRRRYH